MKAKSLLPSIFSQIGKRYLGILTEKTYIRHHSPRIGARGIRAPICHLRRRNLYFQIVTLSPSSSLFDLLLLPLTNRDVSMIVKDEGKG